MGGVAEQHSAPEEVFREVRLHDSELLDGGPSGGCLTRVDEGNGEDSVGPAPGVRLLNALPGRNDGILELAARDERNGASGVERPERGIVRAKPNGHVVVLERLVRHAS